MLVWCQFGVKANPLARVYGSTEPDSHDPTLIMLNANTFTQTVSAGTYGCTKIYIFYSPAIAISAFIVRTSLSMSLSLPVEK